MSKPTTHKRISEKDIKLLWGRAAGLCSICRRKLSQDRATANDAVPLGEQAHIVAEEPNGPRGKSLLTFAERNSYFNLILLCPNHHTEIDKIPAEWPVEKLHLVKRKHELYVETALAETQDAKKRAADLTYTTLIDTAVETCMFEHWNAWTGCALEQPPRWRQEWLDQFDRFGRSVLAAVWPGTKPELESALRTLSIALEIAAHYFNEHIDRCEEGWLVGDKFYRRAGGRPEYWDELEKYGCMAESMGQNGAFQQQAGESVTRGDRRRRELEPRSSSPPLACLLLKCWTASGGNWWSDVSELVNVVTH